MPFFIITILVILISFFGGATNYHAKQMNKESPALRNAKERWRKVRA